MTAAHYAARTMPFFPCRLSLLGFRDIMSGTAACPVTCPSGEDPFLGATLVKPVIENIQRQGVIANAKHW